MRVRPSNIVSTCCALTIGLLLGCDQPAGPDRAGDQPSPTATSSEKKETHPDQPTGQPQSGSPMESAGSK